MSDMENTDPMVIVSDTDYLKVVKGGQINIANVHDRYVLGQTVILKCGSQLLRDCLVVSVDAGNYRATIGPPTAQV